MSLHTKLKSIIKPAVIIPSTLLFLTLASALVLLSSNSNADTTSATASVTVPDTCYMSSTSTTHTGTVSGGTYTENFGGESTVTVTCNDRNGYSVYAVGYSNDIEGTNGLIGTSTGLIIPTGTSTSGDVSNWAMKLTPIAGAFAPTILNGYSNYNVVPTTTTKVATQTSDINVSNSSQFKTSYAVSVAPNQAADTYIGKVKYTVVHPNYANSDGTIPTYTVTLGFTYADSIIIDGVSYTSSSTAPSLSHGTHTISGTYPAGFSSWSSTGSVAVASASSASTTINVTGAGTLTLNGIKPIITFDQAYAAAGKSQTSGYYVMQDMAGTICSNVTDGQAGTLRDTRAGGTNYTVAKIDGLCWMTKNLDLPGGTALTANDTNLVTGFTLPASSTSGFGDFNTDYVYNSGRTTCSSSSSCYSYYSFYTATAHWGTQSVGSPNSSNVDICPKGWRLPTQAEYAILKDNYATSATLDGPPFFSVYSGYYRNERFYSGGSAGFYWSSTNSGNNAYGLYSGTSDTYVSDYTKYNGFAIRCVAKS